MVIGIRGVSGAGKSTLASILCYVLNNPANPNLFEYFQFKKELDNGYVRGKWNVANFASTLKIAMATMYGIDYKQYEDGEFKDTQIGQTIWYLNIPITRADTGEYEYYPILSRNSSEEIDIEYNKFVKDHLGGIEPVITSKKFTWRDTLNEASHGLHLYLGQNIALQAYQHRFDSVVEHLIMGDVRKSKEIDLIEANGGVIIELKRNFIFESSFKEALAFFQKNGYCYNLADGNNPELVKDDLTLVGLQEYEIPVGIDCKPKPNIADTWLNGDDRADFIFHNPLSNPKHQEAFSQMFNDVVKSIDHIVDKLIKNETP